MQFLNRIERVKKFCVVDDQAIILDKNNIILDNVEYPFPSSSLFPYQRNIISAKDFQFSLDERKLKIFENVSGYYFTGIYSQDELLFSNTNYKILDYITLEIKQELPHFEDGSIIFFDGNYFIIRLSGGVEVRKRESQNVIWRKTFKELLNGQDLYIQGEPQLITDVLYIPLLDRKDNFNRSTVAINIGNGEVINTYPDFIWNIQRYKDNLAVCSVDTIKILDVKTDKIAVQNYSQKLKGYERPETGTIYFDSFGVYDANDKFYFRASDNRVSTYFGVINLLTEEIEYFQNINENPSEYKISVRDIKVSEKHVFVHCSDNTLSVYEK